MWVSYMNAIITENPRKTSSLFSSLEPRFSDRPLLEILEAAKKYPTMESAATKMQTKTIDGIFASGKSPTETFKLLRLDNVGDGILSSPLFQTWKNYVEVFNKKRPNHQESWFDPIHINYIPFLVESIIEKAMQNPSTVRIAKQAESAWLQKKLGGGGTSSQPFRFLHLNKAGEKTLASPKFKTWAKYLNDFNHRYPDQKTTMIDGIRANYYDRRLLPILNAAKKDPRTEKLATNLQNALIAKWIAEKKNPSICGTRKAPMK
ncbi:hypothetical protein PC116_g16016 [Phytophthora cactorum]|nr:hypothetical protein Pcac1_g1525 [Phytophthora cactorum]KAG4235864.1 hypothetical protein PC116_g16016 [Phytophthora cactorum]